LNSYGDAKFEFFYLQKIFKGRLFEALRGSSPVILPKTKGESSVKKKIIKNLDKLFGHQII